MSRTDRATFRLPAAALLVPFVALFLTAPIAGTGGAGVTILIVPAIALAWVLVTRTTATADGVTVHGLRGRRHMAWGSLDRLEFSDSHWAVAVGSDDTQLRLPMVRPSDLPRLAEVSGGGLRLDGPEPTPESDQESTQESRQPPDETASATATAETHADGVIPSEHAATAEPAQSGAHQVSQQAMRPA